MESGRWYLFSLLLHYISYIDVEVVIMAMLNRKNETSAQTPATKRDYNDLSRLHDEIDAMFDNFFAPSFFEREPFQMKSDFLPSLDVTSDDKAYAMKVELPGVERRRAHHLRREEGRNEGRADQGSTGMLVRFLHPQHDPARGR